MIHRNYNHCYQVFGRRSIIIPASSLLYMFYSSFSDTKNRSRCLCDTEGSPSSSSSLSSLSQNNTNTNEEDCSVCKYTGMTVCTGLSLYFIKLATEESIKHEAATVTKSNTAAATTTTTTTTTIFDATKKTKHNRIIKNHRPFFYLCSVGWAVAGIYRWYLG